MAIELFEDLSTGTCSLTSHLFHNLGEVAVEVYFLASGENTARQHSENVDSEHEK
jgi:hypothetical protein